MATRTRSLPYLLQILSCLLVQILCSPALVDDVLHFRGDLHLWWQHSNCSFVFQNPLGGIRVNLTLAFINQAHVAREWEWFPGSELYLGLKTLTSFLAMWEGSRLEFVTFLTCASNCISIFYLALIPPLSIYSLISNCKSTLRKTRTFQSAFKFLSVFKMNLKSSSDVSYKVKNNSKSIKEVVVFFPPGGTKPSL